MGDGLESEAATGAREAEGLTGITVTGKLAEGDIMANIGL